MVGEYVFYREVVFRGREIFLFGKSIFARGGLLASSAHEQAESLGVLWESRSAEKIKS